MTMTNMMSATMMMATTPLVFKPCRTHNTSSFQIRLTPLSECTLIIHLHVMSCLRRLMLIITMCLHVQMVTYVIGGFTSWHVVESSASRRTTIPAGWGHECKIPDVMIPGEQRLWSVALDFKSKNQSTSNNRHKNKICTLPQCPFLILPDANLFSKDVPLLHRWGHCFTPVKWPFELACNRFNGFELEYVKSGLIRLH